jgi:hypothetical protein
MMLLRKDGSGLITIPQPRHAWLAGQMTRPRRNLAWFCSAPLGGFCSAVDP